MPRRVARWVVPVFAGIVVLAAAAAWVSWRAAPRPNHRVRDPELARLGAEIYTAPSAPRALVLFFGNDVGFWEPHEELAADLAADGYDVVGIDIRPLFDALPARRPQRDSACAREVGAIVTRARRELALPDAPVVIAGHSLGAELALWSAGRVTIDGMAGVVALSPGTRSHLEVSPSDLLGRDPTGPESFPLTDVMRLLAARELRVAIVRGASDKFGVADSSLIVSGGVDAKRFMVPFAGHSLRRLLLARRVVEDALQWVLAGSATRAGGR